MIRYLADCGVKGRDAGRKGDASPWWVSLKRVFWKCIELCADIGHQNLVYCNGRSTDVGEVCFEERLCADRLVLASSRVDRMPREPALSIQSSRLTGLGTCLW